MPEQSIVLSIKLEYLSGSSIMYVAWNLLIRKEGRGQATHCFSHMIGRIKNGQFRSRVKAMFVVSEITDWRAPALSSSHFSINSAQHVNLFSAFLNQLFALSHGFLNYFCWNDMMHLCLCSCHWCEDLVQECDKICLQPNLITPQFLIMIIVFDCWAPDKGRTKSKLRKSRQLSVVI